MAGQCPGFNLQFHHDGQPCVDFLLYAFVAGTNTPKDTFQDIEGAVVNTHPIVLDEQGRIPGAGFFLEETGAYDFELRDADDNPIDGWTDVSAIPAAAENTFLALAVEDQTMEVLYELAGPAESELQPPTLGQVQDLIAEAVAAATVTLTARDTPVGAIYEWVLEAVPTKHLELNGQAVSRSTYAELFTLWGTTFGVGDGTTTFNLPNRVGMFVRGYDPTGTVDPDGGSRDFASDPQEFAIENIEGEFGTDDRVTATGADNPFYKPGGTPDAGSEGSGTGATVAFDASRAVNTSTETRPVNVLTMWIVKALP